MILADLVTHNGPSAPAWAFFSAISLALIGVLAQQLKARSDIKQQNALIEAAKSEAQKAKNEAQKAGESASQAEANTANLSNGFASSVLAKLGRIEQLQQDSEKAIREHLKWHLDRSE